MKQIAACLLVAVGIGGAGYCADEGTRTPGALVFWRKRRHVGPYP
jgi:hypothetical protein